ncbi:MAG: S1C family serine protease, partial [Myxococcales bacterium]
MMRIVLATACALALLTCAEARAASAKELYAQSSPSVVFVLATSGGSEHQMGTGSVIGSGLVLTNAHVIAGAREVLVYAKPDRLTGKLERDLGKPFRTRVLASDDKLDLALLEVAALDRPALRLASERLHPGEPTIAIGHPESGGPWTLTTGAISNFIEDFEGVGGKHVYQMETPINPGNSGGPLIAASGEVVGVNTAAVKVNRAGLPVSGIQFAVSSEAVRGFLDRSLQGRGGYQEPSVKPMMGGKRVVPTCEGANCAGMGF